MGDSNPLAINLKIFSILGIWKLPRFPKCVLFDWIYMVFLQIMTLNVIIVTISGTYYSFKIV